MRDREWLAVLAAARKAKDKIDKMNKIYPERYKEELNEVGKSVVAQWYATYDPIFYERNRSLYHAFKVNLDGTNYNVEFEPELLGNDIIFWNSFMEGYHGGAKYGETKLGEPHPSPGIPYWKTPIPNFIYWGRPAKRDFSPYNRMISEMNKKIKQIDKEKQKEYDAIIDKLYKSINKLY